MASRLITSEYFAALAEFVRLEVDLGGPDPHIPTLGEMIKDQPLKERIWRAGLYAAGYNVPTAEVIWREWPFERVLEEVEELPAWVDHYWQGFGFRRERRAVRTREKFTRCLVSLADWVENEPKEWWHEDDYDSAWRSTGKIYGLGRYVQLKFLEVLLRYCDGEFIPYDIRSSGGKTPRATLALLYPQYAAELVGNDSRENVRISDMCAGWAREELVERFDAPCLDYFALQVALCEGGKVFHGRQYPGSTHDSELKYYLHARRWWGEESEMLPARARLFDPVCLGEVGGWWDKRSELASTFPEHGYVWSDKLYVYGATFDLANPVRRCP